MYSIHVWHVADRYDSARPSVGSLIPPRDAGDMWVLIVPSLVLSCNRTEVPHWASHVSTLLTRSPSAAPRRPVPTQEAVKHFWALSLALWTLWWQAGCLVSHIATRQGHSTWNDLRGGGIRLLVLVVHAESEVSTNVSPKLKHIQTLDVWCIYLWVLFGANVGKYTKNWECGIFQ